MAPSRTPFHDAHIAAGGRMVEFAGWELPVTYGGLREEHLAVRGGVGIFDVSHMGELRFTGANALASLQWLVTCDVSAVAVGQAQYGVMCNERGGAVDDVFVYRLGEADFLMVVNAANTDKDREWVLAHDAHGADISDQSRQWALLAVQGPGAEAALDPLCSADLTAVDRRGVVRSDVAGVSCWVSRTGYTGEDGFEVFAPWGQARPLWDAIVGAGAVPCGLGARDTLRLEVRNALYGHELNDETSPWQAGLGWVVAEDEPFLGAEALAARKGNESHRLVGILLDGKRIARDGMDVLHDGAVVGTVTSGTRSPSLDRSICLAYVERHLVRPGTRLVIDVRGRHEAGEVVRGPFYANA